MPRDVERVRQFICSLLLILPGSLSAAECTTIDALDMLESTGVAPAGADCATYLTVTSGSGVSCHWEHPYRAASARHEASNLWQTLIMCRDGKALEPDTQVNHPDSYELRSLVHGNTVYVISIKDKGALNRTLVFLRRELIEVSN